MLFSLDETKRWLKVEPSITEDDDVIMSIMQSAQRYIEQKKSIFLSKAEITEYFQELDGELMLSVYPVNSISSLNYRDTSGVWQTITSSDYELTATFPQRLIEAYDVSWPDISDMRDSVKVVYEAGYDDPNKVPAELKMAFQSLVADWYENRENPVREKGTLADKILDTLPYRWP